MKATRTRGKDKDESKLDEREWYFSDRDKVPDDELGACCYWEYGRESKFIRDLAGLMRDRKKLSPQQVHRMNQDLGRLFTIDWPGELFRNMASEFPKPWQSLTPDQRKRGAHFVPQKNNRFLTELPMPYEFPPFAAKATLGDVAWLHGQAQRNYEEDKTKATRWNLAGTSWPSFPRAAARRNLPTRCASINGKFCLCWKAKLPDSRPIALRGSMSRGKFWPGSLTARINPPPKASLLDCAASGIRFASKL
jgi:hypothetical protein